MAGKLNFTIIVNGEPSICIEVDQETLDVSYRPINGKFSITPNQAAIFLDEDTIDIISDKIE